MEKSAEVAFMQSLAAVIKLIGEKKKMHSLFSHMLKL